MDGNENIKTPTDLRRLLVWVLVSLAAIVGCYFTVATVALAIRPEMRSILIPFFPEPSQEIIYVTVQVPITQLPQPTPTYAPPFVVTQVVTREVTVIVTPTPPPVTQTPRSTITYTATPEYYREEEPAQIAPSVTIRMRPTFGTKNSVLCWAPNPGYNLVLTILNATDRQFLLRFEGRGFSAIDNLGREYALKASGINGCSGEPGLRSMLINSGYDESIMVSFSGEIGLEVDYILLTVDNISGTGPIVFRKDI